MEEQKSTEAKAETKLVPESDLMAVKARLEKERAELESKLTEVEQKAEAHYSSLLSERAAREKLAAELEELRKEVEQLRGIEPLKEQAEARAKELEQQLLAVTVKRLSQVYKIPEEKLAGKTLAELNTIEEALKLVGREPGRYDITGAGIGAEARMSAMDKIRAGFEQLGR